MSKLRGAFGAGLFLKELLDGKSIPDAKAGAREIMQEIAPLVDPALMALEDVAAKHRARKLQQQVKDAPEPTAKDAPRGRPGDDAVVIETTGEEVTEPEPPPRRKPRTPGTAIVRRKGR